MPSDYDATLKVALEGRINVPLKSFNAVVNQVLSFLSYCWKRMRSDISYLSINIYIMTFAVLLKYYMVDKHISWFTFSLAISTTLTV